MYYMYVYVGRRPGSKPAVGGGGNAKKERYVTGDGNTRLGWLTLILTLVLALSLVPTVD